MNNEKEFEERIRGIIQSRISAKDKNLYALTNKKAVDILLCRDGKNAALFFIEIKFHQKHHGRLGFGSAKGTGFQPELLRRKTDYFEKHMRWIIGSDAHPNQYLFLNNRVIRNYVAGGEIGDKFNNIQKRIFAEQNWLNEEQLISQMIDWMSG